MSFVKSALIFGVFTCSCGFAVAQTSSDSMATPVAKKNISPEQLARVTEKAELIRQIFKAAQRDIQGRQIRSEAQRWLLESLYQMPLEQIRRMGTKGTFQQTVEAMTLSQTQTKPQGRASIQAFGDTNQDLVFKPFIPCRYIDTRNVGGKVLPPPSAPRGFDISQSGTAYGGSGACAPLTLTGVDENSIGALAMNVAIFDTSAAAPPGFLGARPAGSTNLTSLLNWDVSSPFWQDSNYGIITMDQTPLANEFEFFTSSDVHVIVDLFGAFIAPNATALDCVTLYNGSATLVLANSEACANPPSCPATYTVTSPLFSKGGATNDGLVVSQMNLNLPGLQVCGRSTLGVSASFTAGVQCCRVPGR
jgi:hypothetical protein